MIRVCQIAILSCVGLILTSCDAPETSGAVTPRLAPDVASGKNVPIWQQVKIGDIAPSRSGKRPSAQLLKTTDFNIYIFDIPAENISVLDNIWLILSTKPLRFNDYSAFGANSFSAGFGQNLMWNEIADSLNAAGAKRAKTVSLLIPDGQANNITIARLRNEQTIFYTSTVGSTKGATIGPGTLTLRIKAEKPPGSREVCKMSALPLFSSPTRRSFAQSAPRKDSGDFLFNAAGFELKMSPGDFVFLGPEKYIGNQITLAGLFFSRPEPRPTVRTYLIVCTRIND